MRVLHNGAALRHAVDAVLGQLPAGRLALLSTSIEGIALAAATAIQRPAPTAWQSLDVRLGPQDIIVGRPVVIEPVDPGPGWRSAIGRIIPGAAFVFAREDRDRLAA